MGRLGLRKAQDDHEEGTDSSSRAHRAIDRDLPYRECQLIEFISSVNVEC